MVGGERCNGGDPALCTEDGDCCKNTQRLDFTLNPAETAVIEWRKGPSATGVAPAAARKTERFNFALNADKSTVIVRNPQSVVYHLNVLEETANASVGNEDYFYVRELKTIRKAARSKSKSRKRHHERSAFKAEEAGSSSSVEAAAQSCNKKTQLMKKPSALPGACPARRKQSARKTKKVLLEERQRTIERCIRSGFADGLEVHHFIGKGRGIVATRHFDAGEFVLEYTGELIDTDEATRREKYYSEDVSIGSYMYFFNYKNRKYCVDATANTGKLGRLVNHSKKGNLVTRVFCVDGVPRLILLAKTHIEAGAEITFDYGDRSKKSVINNPWLAL